MSCFEEFEFNTTIELSDGALVDATVVFEYTPASKIERDCPGYESEVDICGVLIDSTNNDDPIDIVNDLTDSEIKELETVCFDIVKEQKEEYKGDMADYKVALLKDESDFY